MLKNILLPALVLLFVIGFSCRKDCELPEPTQNGKGGFAFLMNGEVWEPCSLEGAWTCFLCPPDPDTRVEYLGQNSVSMDFHRKCDSLFQIVRITLLRIQPDLKTENWFFTYHDFRLPNDECNNGEYHIDSTEFTLKVTRFDSGIVSGEFKGKLINDAPHCLDTLLIEQGRFDFKIW